MRPEDIRAIATALPEVAEKAHFGRPAYRVRDKLFVSVHDDEDNPFAIVHVSQRDAAADARSHPDALEEVWRIHGDKRIFVGLRVELPTIDTERCQELIERAWQNKAPKGLASLHDQEG